MLRLLLLCALAHIAHCSCPSGFELVSDGQCRGSYANMSNNGYNVIPTIVDKCGEIGGQPVIIHNDEEQTYWSKRGYPYPFNIGDPLLMLGILCNTTSRKYTWVDGSPVDFMPKIHHSALDASSCTENYHFFIQLGGYWAEWNAGNTFKVDISCTKQLQQPVRSPDGCDGFEDDSDDGVCYQIGATAENWQDAQMICKKLGANLPSIHNQQENSFLRRLAVSKGAVNGLFLGAISSGKGNDFGWVDGSEWDYANFYPGFPKSGLGNCIAMDTSTSAGQWMNTDCSAKLPVTCIRDQKKVSVPTCSSETWQEDVIITSPGFPYTSSTPCDYLLIAADGKRVELEIVYLEANSCCDHLVIYDGNKGASVLAKITGDVQNTTYATSTSNEMRVSWQPSGGVNVLGLAMTFRGV